MSFDRPTRRLQPIRTGQVVRAKRLNEPIHALNRLISGIAPPRQLIGDASKTLSVSIARFVVISASANDYLVCREFDGTARGTMDIYIAKPPLLRASQTARSGINYSYNSAQSRQASNGEDTENQVITPSYLVGDEIYAIRGIVRNTGAFSDPNNTRIVEWLDLNLDARVWAQTEE